MKDYLRIFDLAMYDRKLAYWTIWQRVVQRQIEHGEKKAGSVKSKPLTLYPNILAEIEASGYFLCTIRERAQVTQDIMWAVLEDAEQLTDRELKGLANLFECRIEYLRAPTLQIVYMESNRGKLRRAILGAMLQMIPPMPGEDFYTENQRERAAEVFQIMESGNPVTYAEWRQAVSRCEDVRQKHLRMAHKPRAARLA